VKQASEIRFLIGIVPIWLALAIFCSSHVSGAAATTIGDAQNGKQLFEKRCTGCHVARQEQGRPTPARCLRQKGRTCTRLQLLG